MPMFFSFWVKYQDTWSLPNNFCSINSRRFLLTAVNWLMHAIAVGYSTCTDLPAGHTFLNWSAHYRNLCVTLIVNRLHYYISYYIQA